MRAISAALVAVALCGRVVPALPAGSSPASPPIEERQLLGAGIQTVDGVIDDIVGDASAILSQLEKVIPTKVPTSITEVQSIVASIFSATPTNFFNNVAQLIENSLSPKDLQTVIDGFNIGENSVTNVNPKNPSTPVYPRKDQKDAPYSLTETQLRQAIYIPQSFTYGEKQPVIFVPGTGSFGGVNFASNLRQLLTSVDYADPVWLNIPGAMLNDAQVNAEFIAYAINYINGISSNHNVSVISWSQGGLDTQWVLKYWPSTRSVVSNFLPVSPDFHGTILANLLCVSGNSEVGLNPCDPSVIQQEYTSNYISTLRENGGDSAYVPTTTFYSSLLDEIVEPQHGSSASGYLNDARNVGVTNIEVQTTCPGQPAGSFFTHESMLVNPLTYALIVDALKNGGPGKLERIDKGAVCQQLVAPGISLEDYVATESLIPIAAVLLLTYLPKFNTEPAIMGYAQ